MCSRTTDGDGGFSRPPFLLCWTRALDVQRFAAALPRCTQLSSVPASRSPSPARPPAPRSARRYAARSSNELDSPAVIRRSDDSFEVVLIDDTTDCFVVSSEAELPGGVTIFEERISWTGHNGQPNLHSVHVSPQPGEGLAGALLRIEPWLQSFKLPADTRVGWQAVTSYDEAVGKPVFTGWRSFILRGAPVLTERDIARAAAAPDFDGGRFVAITLSPAAADRFRMVTRAHVRQRIAILLDGQVESAPIVMSEIGGGELRIALDEGKSPAEIEGLVKSLSGATK
jgi:hypothetical protein